MPNENLRDKIAGIRRTPSNILRAYEKRERVTQIAITDLRNRGTFFKTSNRHFYFHKGEVPQLLPLDLDSVALSAFIEERFGLNEAERYEYRHLVTGLRNEAFLRGQNVQLYKLAHYAQETHKLYVSRFDGWLYRLDGREIEQCANGTDGIFFEHDPQWQPYKLIDGTPQREQFHGLLINSVNFASSERLSAADQRWLFHRWMLAQFFDSLHPTKPILLIWGEKGGGKSLAFRKWLKMLFGERAEVTALERTKPDGFVAAVSSEAVAVFDNVDERITWLPDHLCQLATGAAFRRRKLYTTNEEAEYIPRCWAAMTSRTPKFIDGRDDVVDRTIILQTERRSDFQAEQVLLRAIQQNRDLLWTELLRELNRIVAFTRQHGGHTKAVTFRMADFGAFAALADHALGQRGTADRVFRAMEQRQSNMLLAEEPISICLQQWLKNPENQGRKVSSGTLQTELMAVAVADGTPWPYRNPHALGQRLKNIRSNLNSDFTLDVERDSAKQYWYKFWPKAEVAEFNPQKSKQNSREKQLSRNESDLQPPLLRPIPVATARAVH